MQWKGLLPNTIVGWALLAIALLVIAGLFVPSLSGGVGGGSSTGDDAYVDCLSRGGYHRAVQDEDLDRAMSISDRCNRLHP